MLKATLSPDNKLLNSTLVSTSPSQNPEEHKQKTASASEHQDHVYNPYDVIWDVPPRIVSLSFSATQLSIAFGKGVQVYDTRSLQLKWSSMASPYLLASSCDLTNSTGLTESQHQVLTGSDRRV